LVDLPEQNPISDALPEAREAFISQFREIQLSKHICENIDEAMHILNMKGEKQAVQFKKGKLIIILIKVSNTRVLSILASSWGCSSDILTSDISFKIERGFDWSILRAAILLLIA